MFTALSLERTIKVRPNFHSPYDCRKSEKQRGDWRILELSNKLIEEFTDFSQR